VRWRCSARSPEPVHDGQVNRMPLRLRHAACSAINALVLGGAQYLAGLRRILPQGLRSGRKGVVFA
jgi:hypothetical protein